MDEVDANADGQLVIAPVVLHQGVGDERCRERVLAVNAPAGTSTRLCVKPTVNSRLAFGLAVMSFVIVSTRPPKKFCRKAMEPLE